MSNETIDAYGTYAHEYDDSVADFWNRFPTDFIDKFVEHAPGKRVLNVGSGSGRDALLLRDRGMEVLCTNGSQAMADVAKSLGFELIHEQTKLNNY